MNLPSAKVSNKTNIRTGFAASAGFSSFLALDLNDLKRPFSLAFSSESAFGAATSY